MHLTDDRCWGLQQAEATGAAVIAIRRARRESSWRVVTVVAAVPCRRLQLALQALHKPKRMAQCTVSAVVGLSVRASTWRAFTALCGLIDRNEHSLRKAVVTPAVALSVHPAPAA